jgi:hypothetical protein
MVKIIGEAVEADLRDIQSGCFGMLFGMCRGWWYFTDLGAYLQLDEPWRSQVHTVYSIQHNNTADCLDLS